jgi:hypothetical protein
MRGRDEAVAKIVKILRLARGAGTDEEAHAALVRAQRMMYEHEIDEREVEAWTDADAVTDLVVDRSGRLAPWREYLAAVVVENFRCALVISRSRSTGESRLVFVGRRGDVEIAKEAFEAAATAGESLASAYANDRGDAARASYLTGFLAGLYTRFQESVAANALALLTDPAVTRHAELFVNAGEAAGGGLAAGDAEAVRDGYDTGYDFGDGTRRLPE